MTDDFERLIIEVAVDLELGKNVGAATIARILRDASTRLQHLRAEVVRAEQRAALGTLILMHQVKRAEDLLDAASEPPPPS